MPWIGFVTGPRRSFDVADHKREFFWSQQGFGSGGDGGTASLVLFDGRIADGLKVAFLLRRLLKGGQALVNSNIIRGTRLEMCKERLGAFHGRVGGETVGGGHGHDDEKSRAEECGG